MRLKRLTPKVTLLLVLVALHLAPIWLFTYFPTQDGSSHIYNAYVLKEYHKHQNYRLREVYTLNLLLFPNVFLMDQTSTQIRIIQPLAVDETEVSTVCIAPVGESAEARAVRLRQYEDFFNSTGMAIRTVSRSWPLPPATKSGSTSTPRSTKTLWATTMGHAVAR